MQKLIKITDDHYVVVDDDGTRTHSTIDIKGVLPLSLQEVKELIEVDVEKKAHAAAGYPKNEGDREKFYIKGYNQAIEDNKEKKYTEEDMRKAWNAAYIDAMSIDEETYKPLFFEDFIQSLQHNTEWEVEFIDNKLTLKQ